MNPVHLSHARKATHHAHLLTHVAYLAMVYFHSPYYGIAAGALGVVVVIGEVVERKAKKATTNG